MVIVSDPKDGTEYRIKELKLDSDLKMIVLYDSEAGAEQCNIESNPTVEQYRIKEIKLDSTKKMVVIYDSELGNGSGEIVSIPSAGEYTVVGMRLDADLKVIVTYHAATLIPKIGYDLGMDMFL